MSPEEALTFLETILPPGSLNNVRILVFQRAWEGKGYNAIAEEADYDPDYIKGVAAQLWKYLSDILGEKVTKKNFRALLLQHFKHQDSRALESRTLELRPLEPSILDTKTLESKLLEQKLLESKNFNPQQVDDIQESPSKPISFDWGTAPDVSVFYGRSTERNQLQKYIVKNRCKVVALLGHGGIGKTTLSVKIAEQVQSEFAYVIWRTLRNAPTLDTILTELIGLLSDYQEAQISVRKLLNYLRGSRSLIILDNVETILQAGKTGYYRPGYEDYGELLRIVAETAHQSCLMLTSREKPPELASEQGMDDSSVQVFYIQGSLEVAQAILQAKKIRGTASQKQQVCQYYGNSPLALKIIATSIQDLFDGDLNQFLEQGSIAFNGIRRLLEQQFQRLTTLEKTIINWLAINRDWTSITELYQDIIPVTSKANLLEALESLTCRCLVEKQSGCYTLQPVVMEFVTNNLIGQIYQELIATTFNLFGSYALIKTTSKDFIQESQRRLILEPIAHLLRHTFASPQVLVRQVQTILVRLRGSSLTDENSLTYTNKIYQDSDLFCSDSVYAAGNLINLCIHLQIDLTGYDFSHLTIYHADLKYVNLHNCNFVGANFARTSFAQSLGGILQLAYSTDGKFLATGDTHGSIQLWGIPDCQLRATFLGHRNWVWSLVISPDGKIIASGGEDNLVRLWEVETQSCFQTLPLESEFIWSLKFSLDGNQIAIATSEGKLLLWDIQTKKLRIFTGHTGDVHSISFSRDGTYLASASHDRTIKLWDIKSGKCLQTFCGHKSLVYGVEFSPNGQNLASGSQDRTVKLWDTCSGKCQITYVGHEDSVFSVVFTPNGQNLASCSADRTVRLWDINSGECIKIFQGHDEMIRSIAISPDGKTLASGSYDQTLRLWRINDGNKLKTIKGHINCIYGLAWHPTPSHSQDNILASGGTDKTVKLWNTNNGKCLKTLTGHEAWVWSVAWSPDGKTLASGSFDRTIKLWNVNNGECVKTLQGHEAWVWSVAWSPNSKILASGSGDLSIKLWNPNNGECLQTLQGHEDWVWSVAWSPDSKILASGSADYTVKLWNIETGECLHTLEVGKIWVWAVAWSPEGNILASIGGNYNILLWDVNSQAVIATCRGHTETPTGITFSPDGKTLFTASQDQTLRIWDTYTGQCLKVFKGHNGAVFPVTCSSDGEIIATGSEDGTIKLWNIRKGECWQTLNIPGLYEGMNITGMTGLTTAQKIVLKKLGAVSGATGI
ncbi:MAG: NB-ARC domain-containing protein [Mastigocoleus sp. MO_167.B18]|nr:NB-ARC domain-containing protein [Mastigocoleus sp. MO_167.B18]